VFPVYFQENTIMEHLQISGNIRVFHTSERKQKLDQLLQAITDTKVIDDGYLHVTTFEFRRLYLAVEINADAIVSTWTDIREALKGIGSLMTLDSGLMTFGHGRLFSDSSRP
jgi:hypothetical protein